jgi:hypothetical protein
VRVLGDHGATRTVAMGAWRDGIPIAWVAEQINDPKTPHIAFRHLRGWTRGMDVEWTFTPLDDGRTTRVRIEHRLAFAFPIAAEWIGRVIVSDYFIHGVAARTLARIKAIAEAGPQ